MSAGPSDVTIAIFEAAGKRERIVSTAGKLRLVVGLFEGLDDLHRALCELAEEGYPSESLCVLAHEAREREAKALDQQFREASGDGLARFVVMGHNSGSVLRNGRNEGSAEAYDRLARTDPRGIDLDLVRTYTSWAFGRQARQLEDLLSIGGYALFVRVGEDDEQQMVGRILLDHARNGVQTHELRRRG